MQPFIVHPSAFIHGSGKLFLFLGSTSFGLA
jgi:hypothetical protein